VESDRYEAGNLSEKSSLPVSRRGVRLQVVAIIAQSIGHLVALSIALRSTREQNCLTADITKQARAAEESTMKFTSILHCIFLAAITLIAVAQQPSQDSLIKIQISQNISTVNYLSGGSTMIGFAGTALLPRARGTAKVTSRHGTVQIQAKFSGLDTSQNFGPEYLVYVLWAITPEGNATNLGQLTVKDQRARSTSPPSFRPSA
jgi:hypothetical protein